MNMQLKIQTRIFLIIIGILFIFALLLFIIQNFSFKIYNDILNDAVSGTLYLYTINFERQLDEIFRMSFNIVTHPDLQNKLKRNFNANLSVFEQYKTRQEIKDYLEFIISTEKSIKAIILADRYGNQYKSADAELWNDTEKKISFFKDKILDRQGVPVWLNPEDSRQTLFLVRELREIEGAFLHHLGILIIQPDMKKILDVAGEGIAPYDIILSLFLQDKLLYVTDNQINTENTYGKFKDRQNGYIIDRADNASFLATLLKSARFEWTYLSLLPYNKIISRITALSRFIFICYAVIFVLTIFLIKHLIRGITEPIIHLAGEMKRIEKLDFSITHKALKKYSGSDEIGVLYGEFDLMLEKIHSLVRDNYEKQLILRENELKMLQTQINPHFLYNTFDSINWLARMNKQTKIAIMINSLGHLLRDSINNPEKVITIKEEAKLQFRFFD